MRTTSKLITVMLALALLGACSKNEMNELGNGEEASITITRLPKYKPRWRISRWI